MQAIRTCALAVAAMAMVFLGGCTSTQENAAVAGVQTACQLAGLGAQIYVQVSGAGVANTIVQPATAAGCSIVTAGAQALVNQLIASGAAADVSVKVVSASGVVDRQLTRKHVMQAYRDVQTGTTVYHVDPGFLSGLPIVGGLL